MIHAKAEIHVDAKLPVVFSAGAPGLCSGDVCKPSAILSLECAGPVTCGEVALELPISGREEMVEVASSVLTLLMCGRSDSIVSVELMAAVVVELVV